MLTVDKRQHVELLALGILLAGLLEFEATQGEVYLWILAEDIFLPTVAFAVEVRLLDDVILT